MILRHVFEIGVDRRVPCLVGPQVSRVLWARRVSRTSTSPAAGDQRVCPGGMTRQPGLRRCGCRSGSWLSWGLPTLVSPGGPWARASCCLFVAEDVDSAASFHVVEDPRLCSREALTWWVIAGFDALVSGMPPCGVRVRGSSVAGSAHVPCPGSLRSLDPPAWSDGRDPWKTSVERWSRRRRTKVAYASPRRKLSARASSSTPTDEVPVSPGGGWSAELDGRGCGRRL